MNKGFALISGMVILAGCASPGFLRQPMHAVDVSGSKFKVYMRSGTSQVEAHRVSAELLPSRVLIYAKAIRAIEIATRCKVEDGSLAGDQAIVTADVDCMLP
jgi:hypothetical protein